ncbi:MAG TPA: ATP-binding protein, partial [Candidatus Cloacimonadota bacterium]|nr:ATP-binding protein [Candidatus Cloacimonadota bacterium]
KGEKDTVEQIENDYRRYIAGVRGYQREGNPSEAVIRQMEGLRNQIRKNCLRLLQLNQDAMFRKSSATQKIARQGKSTLILVSIFVFVLGTSLSWGLSRRIVLPILRLKEATQKLGQGDYNFELKPEGEDELGILTHEFGVMAGKIKEFNDLNIRKIVEEQRKIEAIFSNIRDGIFLIGTDYRVLDANQPSLDIYRLKRNELIGHHFLEIAKDDKLFADLKVCLGSRRQVIGSEAENILAFQAGNKHTYLEYSFSPVIDDKQELMGALFILRDVTNLKELDKLKSEFVMIASHELKTPLTSINMSIDLLRESLGNDPKAQDIELIEIAKEDINRLRALVSDLLDLSKIDAGRIELDFRPIEPSALLTTASQYYKNQLNEKQASMEIFVPSEIGRIWCDEVKLLLVLSNLISNALKAIPDFGKIRLSAEASGKYVLFAVEDNGHGIALQYQNKIFDRFVQVEDGNSARGTGLGLTISREIVRAHGGSIWVESEPEKGSTFCFTVPLEPQNIHLD